MRVLSLFSGIGLGDLGLMMAGMEIVGQVEIDDYCQKILKLRWPDVPKWKDIKLVKPEELPTADLISGGFPCQPFSVAGKRRGKEDDRHLWPQMARIIEAKRPTWVLGENVSGIVKMGLDEVLSDLENLGYACQTFNIPACATDADHKRARIWIVAYSLSNKYRRAESRCAGQEGKIQEFNRKKNCSTGGAIGTSENASKSFQPGLERHAGHVSDGYKSGRIDEEQDGSTGQNDLHYRERWRLLESGIRRVAHGVPNQVDRLKALGNGQHVHTVYEIGRLIMEFDQARK